MPGETLTATAGIQSPNTKREKIRTLGLVEDALAETADLAIAGERRDEPLGVDLLGGSRLAHGWFRKVA